MITQSQLTAFAKNIPSNKITSLLSAINACIARPDFALNTGMRVAYFMTHTNFETGGYLTWSENLDYTTPQRLCAVWPTHFTLDLTKVSLTLVYAPLYVNNPQGLGNFIYANRNGNGSVASGDGYNFRGQGGLQLTGKTNYQKASTYLFTDSRLIDKPLTIQDIGVAMLTAGWFWQANNINSMADVDGLTNSTITINGSSATVPQRAPVLTLAKSIFM